MSAVTARRIVLVVIVVLAACAPPQLPGHITATERPATTTPRPLPRATPTVQATTTPFQLEELPTSEPAAPATSQIEPGFQALIDTAIADLAQRLSIDRKTIEVISAQSVVWPDRGLGCPQPGMGYVQVLSEGFRIELRAKNQLYAYHGGGGRGPFLCENPPE